MIKKLQNCSAGKRRFPAIIHRIPAVLFLLCILTSFRPAGTGYSVTIHYRAYIQGEPLQLNKKYQNVFGESFEISRFRFYAGRIALVYTDSEGRKNTPSPYHLIDFSDSASTRIDLPVTAGSFNGIEFQLGIDSADQCSGAQTGVLDPARGMFWTWNTGYQSFKIEGYSPSSDQPAHMVAYHIGGYRIPYNTVWKLMLGTTNDEVYRISNEKQIIIEIPLELDNFFEGPKPLHIKEFPTCTTPGELARKISENFIGTFTGLTITTVP